MDEYEYEKYEYKDHTIRIMLDPEPTDPREWDNTGTMIVRYGRYTLGDRDFESDEERAMHRGFHVFERYMRMCKDALRVLPLSVYEHSGMTMWVGAPITSGYRSFDSSFVGAIVAFKDRVEEMGSPVDRLDEILKGEVEEYDKYLRGEAYGFEILNSEGDVTDSCWGFSDIEDAKKEAESYL